MPHPHGDKHFGRGTQPKGTGTGAMTDIDKDKIGDNAVLSKPRQVPPPA